MTTFDQHTLQVQQLFVRHQSALKAFALALGVGTAEADDVMQEVFLAVSKKARDFEIGTNFTAWARSITRYEVSSARRKSSRIEIKPEVLDALQAACPDDFADDGTLTALTHCMEQLAPKAQEIVRLRYHYEHGPGEIGQLLTRSVNSINVALSKARIVLRDCIDRRLKMGEAS